MIALRWPRNRGGVVVKFAPKRMLVRWDGLTEDTRTSTADLRPETAEDVGLRAHAAAVSAWKARQPQIAHAAVCSSTAYYGLRSLCARPPPSCSSSRIGSRRAQMLMLADERTGPLEEAAAT